MAPKANAEAERRDWTIEALVPGGDGMAVLADGRVAFVSGGLPGDVISPVGVEARKGSLRATRWNLIRPSAERISPPCPVVDRCGGCDWMHLARGAQLIHKERLLRRALERTGKIRLPDDPIPVTGAGPPLEYRSRTRFHIDGEGRIGFFERRAHALVEIHECLVCRPELNRALTVLRKLPRSVWMEFSEIELRHVEGIPVSALLRPRVPGALSKTTRSALSKVAPEIRISVSGEGAGEQDKVELPLGVHLRAAPGVFTQVNWAVNAVMVEAVIAGARDRAVRRFCDAYAGVGNFSIPLLAQGMIGVSIEKDARAVDCARAAAREQGLSEAGFTSGDVRQKLGELARAQERFDMVLLDPPRSGAEEVLHPIRDLAPRHVAYVSCDPVTLARDLGVLHKTGYAVREIRAFDMFPQTHHLETLVWLEPTSSRAKPSTESH